MRLAPRLFATLATISFAAAAHAAPGSVTRPRLLTGDDLLNEPSRSGSPGALILVAGLITLATLAWWAWWAIRYRAAGMDNAELAFRRLSRVVGLTRSDRECLRSLCRQAGVEPLAALASPQLASLACSGQGAPPRRITRLRLRLCDTGVAEAGRNVA